MKTKKLLFFFLVTLVTLVSACKKEKKPETLPTVVTNAVTNITSNTASVSGKITSNGNTTITEAGFVFSNIVAEPTTSDNKLKVTNFDTFTAELSGLTSGKKYKIRAYAINSQGIGYGDILTFETGNQAPTVSNVQIVGEVAVGKTVSANYTYLDAEGDTEAGTSFQWYGATNGDGTGEAAISGATTKTFEVTDAQNGKFLRVSVTPKAASGTIAGLEVKSAFTASVGGETVTFTYNGTQLTYGTILSSKTGKKWLDRNLGATRVAQSVTDYQAYGDMFQWGRLADGHQLVNRTGPNDADAIGVNGVTKTTSPYETSDTNTPSTNKFIARGGFTNTGDWRTTPNNDLWQGVNGINNPCPTGWRIPTAEEWKAEDLLNLSDAFTKLKLTYSGSRLRLNGAFELSNSSGLYWTSSRQLAIDSFGQLGSLFVSIGNTSFGADGINARAAGLACRCIKN